MFVVVTYCLSDNINLKRNIFIHTKFREDNIDDQQLRKSTQSLPVFLKKKHEENKLAYVCITTSSLINFF